MPRVNKVAFEDPLKLIEATLPWKCTHFGDESEIEANIKGKWKTITIVHSLENLDAEDVADFIIRAMNNTLVISKNKNWVA